MKRVMLAALATTVFGGLVGCDNAVAPGNGKGNASSNTVSVAKGTLVNLKVPNMT